MCVLYGKKYAVRATGPETHEKRIGLFSERILPESLLDLPEAAGLRREYN